MQTVRFLFVGLLTAAIVAVPLASGKPLHATDHAGASDDCACCPPAASCCEAPAQAKAPAVKQQERADSCRDCSSQHDCRCIGCEGCSCGAVSLLLFCHVESGLPAPVLVDDIAPASETLTGRSDAPAGPVPKLLIG